MWFGAIMAKTELFVNIFMKRTTSITHLPTLLALLDTDMKTFFVWEEDGLDDSLDYLLEAVLEHVTVLLKNNADEFRLEVEKNGMSMNSLMDVVRNEWLQLMEVPGGTAYEINVRAAEFLGECSKASGEALDMQIDRIKSDDWHIRMWGAQAIRAMKPPNADELLTWLQSDSFEDDNGNFLVREAAGFSSEG